MKEALFIEGKFILFLEVGRNKERRMRVSLGEICRYNLKWSK